MARLQTPDLPLAKWERIHDAIVAVRRWEPGTTPAEKQAIIMREFGRHMRELVIGYEGRRAERQARQDAAARARRDLADLAE